MTFADLAIALRGYLDAHAPKTGGEAPSHDEALQALLEETRAGNR